MPFKILFQRIQGKQLRRFPFNGRLRPLWKYYHADGNVGSPQFLTYAKNGLC